MEVPRDTRVRNEDSDTRDIYSAVDVARIFQNRFTDSDKARAYVDPPRNDAGIVERFMIGYAPHGFSGLRDALGNDPRRMQLLERLAVLQERQGRRLRQVPDLRCSRSTIVVAG